MSPIREPYEFDARETADLLAELDRRLRERGVAASVFVVGGAAIAATGAREGRLTLDIDAVTRDQEVLDEAHRLGRERGLPPGWLNPDAKMWMPPLPAGVLDRPDRPGLRVTYADDGFLLATKLIAQRAKDARDIVALATRLGLLEATPQDLERHLRSYYTDDATLEFIIEGNDISTEITMLCRDASRMLLTVEVEDIATERPTTPRAGVASHERRQPPPSTNPPRSHPSR
ncbi:MAG: hypothetical protein JWN84_1865 [Nocardioides sp.]|nr:hypothetical protein [Nocardioides sp.]